MKIEFNGTMAWGAVSKGRLAFDVERTEALQKAVKKLHEFEQKKGPQELTLSMEIRMRGKTNLQLATYYSLVKILAHEWNGGQIGPHGYDAEQVDEALKQSPWWPKVITPKGDVPKLKRKMTTVELGQVIDALFDELAGMGVTNTEEIGLYWQRWRQHLADEGIELYTGTYTKDVYRTMVVHCEACGKYIADGGGSIAHVIAKGMGGDPSEDTTFTAAERMHLCDPCHASYDNGQGRAAFIERFPHLKRKIEEGVKKEVVDVVRQIFQGEVRDDLF
jgi:hypothetical protein